MMNKCGEHLTNEAMTTGGDGAPARVDIHVFSHPDEFTPEATRLFATAERTRVGFGADWFRNFIETVPLPNARYCFYVLSADGRSVAGLPVLVRNASYPKHNSAESLGNYYTTLYSPALAEGIGADELTLLVARLLADMAPLSTLRFAPMDRDSREYVALRNALKLKQLAVFEFFSFGNWYTPVDGGWDTYFSKLHGKLRNTVRRMEKKLQSESGRIEVITELSEVDRGIAAYEAVYSGSWKQPEPFSSFMPGLIRSCARRGWMRLGIVSLQGRPIAAQFWIVANGKAEIYKVAYDEKYKAYSPGTLLTAKLIKHVIEVDGVREVDYLIGDDAYKKNWMSDRRERWGLIAYNPRTPGGLLGLCREQLGRYIKRATSRWSAASRSLQAQRAANS